MELSFRPASSVLDGYGRVSSKILEHTTLDLIDDKKVREYGLLLGYPDLERVPAKKFFVYTMWESTALPDFFIENLKDDRVVKVFVPSKWVQLVFKAHGIDSEVIRLGIDKEDFHPEPEVKKYDKFTFLHYNAFNTRKGWMELFEAFTQAFDKKDPVKLILKANKKANTLPMGSYPNIEVIKADLSQEQLRKLINRCHCFVFPSRGEGFGLTPLEAMACGVPAIAPNEHGITEYFNSDLMMEVKTKPVDAVYATFDKESWGKQFKADTKDLRIKLQRAMKKAGKIDKKELIDYANSFTNKEMVKELDKRIREYFKD